jgi:hypothetical protein
VETDIDPAFGRPWIFEQRETAWTCEVSDPTALRELLSALGRRPVNVLRVLPKRTTLEEVFFTFIGSLGDR